MYTNTLVLLLAFAVSCRAQLILTGEAADKEKRLPHKECGKSADDIRPTIVGGKPAKLGEFPWMALLGYKRKGCSPTYLKFLCGGSLITDQHVITAAHCIPVKKNGVVSIYELAKVRLGELDHDPHVVDNATPKDYDIAKSTVHPGYNTYHKINDLAIIKLSEKVQLTDLVHPICLPPVELRSKSFFDEMPTVAGWGITGAKASATFSTRLMNVKVAVANKDYCRGNLTLRLRELKIDDSVMCAGTIGKDSCQGDSGGPLMYNYEPSNYEAEDNRWYIIGVVSYGYSCGLPNFPGVYSNVTNHLPWILETLDI